MGIIGKEETRKKSRKNERTALTFTGLLMEGLDPPIGLSSLTCILPPT
jgi:hypothetical protein